MPVINRIAEFGNDMRAWRRHLHAIPELDFDLPLTAAFVAERLRAFGCDEVVEGIARTGIVATIRGRGPGPTIGLRADMDALPITEATGLPYASRHAGQMHACGHDGHTAMLLGAARYLAETRRFAGSVALIFQPSEELSGGAEVMCAEGIMERFGIARVFGLHNLPGTPFGRIETRPGAIMAASDQFEIVVRGRGGHAAFPHDCIDTVSVAVQIAQALNTIVARQTDPLSQLVVSLTIFQTGSATNVVPETARLGGTVRSLDDAVRRAVPERMRTMSEGIAAAFGATATLDYSFGYPVTRNHLEETALAIRVAEEVVGGANVLGDRPPEMGAEDFAYMLERRPGSYVFLGAGPGAGLHHAEYDFNDEISPIGASWYARLVETAQPVHD